MKYQWNVAKIAGHNCTPEVCKTVRKIANVEFRLVHKHVNLVDLENIAKQLHKTVEQHP